jgi:hypothetical protein
MKVYKPLIIPEDTAWTRNRWKRFLPIWLKQFIQGVSNIFIWMPTIYNDRNWDYGFIFIMLQKKLELQRAELIGANRHTEISRDNKYLTLCLNLIERIREDYYSIEYTDYQENKHWFEPLADKPGYSEWKSETIWEKYDEYLSKYPRQLKLHLQKNPEDINDKSRCCIYVAHENQRRCQALLFKIINEQIGHWWD